MRVFVTGASGWIGSAVVPALVGAGHRVVGLARSEQSASALASAGVEVVRGDIDDLDLLGRTATETDGVVHLAFKHDVAFTGDFAGAAAADRAAIEAFGTAMAGSSKPLLIASGALGLAVGRVATEDDGRVGPGVGGPVNERMVTAQRTLALADDGIRTCVVRLPPTCHGKGDNGFMPAIVAMDRAAGVAGYPGDGTSRWSATHRLDVADAFTLALDMAPAGSVVHAVAEEGVTMRSIAEVIGRHLEIPVQAVADEAFGFLAGFVGIDSPVSSRATRTLLGWQPSRPGLIADLDEGHYFEVAGG